MIKKILMIMAGLLSIQMCCSSCGGAVPAGTETDGTPTENTATDIESDTVTEAPEPSPYLIPDAAHVDLTAFTPELFNASFRTGQASVPELTENGVIFKADKQSRDPYVYFKMNSMYKAAGYPAREDGENFVPFTADEKKTVVLKVQTEWGGAFEMFYTTGKYKEVKSGRSIVSVYGGDSEFFGDRVTQYVVFDASKGVKGWSGTFNDGFRFDYTNYVDEDFAAANSVCADF